MGRISDIVPPLYFSGKNDVKKFIDALDVEITAIEKEIKKIPELVDVDRCEDDKLPYLAAITNAPLVGENPVLRRRQIRNWPYLLKIKGTQRSLEVYLNSIGATDHHISTYFRDVDGEYTEDKPEGEPFLDENGIWRNVRTHYFGIETTWENNHYLNWREWHEEFIELVSFWLKRLKPFHAELLKWDTCIKDTEELDLYVGTGSLHGTVHELKVSAPDNDSEIGNITTGVGILQGNYHEIDIVAPDLSFDKKLYYGCGIYSIINVEIK